MQCGAVGSGGSSDSRPAHLCVFRQDGTETAQRIGLSVLQNAGKPEEHGSGERVPWQNRGELFSTRRFDGGQLNGSQYNAAGNANDETAKCPRRGRIRQSNG